MEVISGTLRSIVVAVKRTEPNGDDCGGHSSKAHSQTLFKGRHAGESTANRGEEFYERDIAVQKYSCSHLQLGACGIERWAASAAGESKPRGQPSLIATIIYADTTSTWTTYEDLFPK